MISKEDIETLVMKVTRRHACRKMRKQGMSVKDIAISQRCSETTVRRELVDRSATMETGK